MLTATQSQCQDVKFDYHWVPNIPMLSMKMEDDTSMTEQNFELYVTKGLFREC